MNKYKHKINGSIAEFVFTKSLTKDGFYSIKHKEGFTHIPIEFIENSNDWEEVKEGIGQEPYIWKLYEPKEELNYLITSFKSKNHHMKINQDGSFGNLGWTLESMLKDKDYEIFSVKNSKGEEFTIGDNVFFLPKNSLELFKIDNFFININGILLARSSQERYAICQDINTITKEVNMSQKAKQPIYTTTDNNAIFKGDSLTLFLLRRPDSHCILPYQKVDIFQFSEKDKEVADRYLTFTSEENRDKYIKENTRKPIFVSADGVEIFDYDYNLFSIYPRDTWTEKRCRVKQAIEFENWLHFHTKEARQEYIDNNKPKYSLADIEKAYESPQDSPLFKSIIKNLKALGK